MSNVHGRTSPAAHQADAGELRRFYPRYGSSLTLGAIRGPWRPSGTVGGMGVFAVIWSTGRGSFWAALHDFEPAAQLRLVAECRAFDQEAAARWRG